MRADEHLQAGNVREALQELQEQMRRDPSDSKKRVFLFQLLSVAGEWARAGNQLEVLGQMDASTLAMVNTYREALRSELLRAEIFSGRRSPILFGEPQEWMALLIEALRLTAEGQHVQAGELREKAFEAAPGTSGAIDGQPFEWIADADTRLGPMCEAIVGGRYTWVPFQRIHRITLEKPADLRDFVWMPAHFTWANGGEMVGLIPARYPGSEAQADGALQLGRKTEWVEDGGTYFGLGQRLLATDIGEFPLLDVREIVLDTLETSAETKPSGTNGAQSPGTGTNSAESPGTGMNQATPGLEGDRFGV